MKTTVIKKEITERRVCTWDDIRLMCIRNNFYTCGSNVEYNALARLVEEHSDDMSNEVLCEVAENILNHSAPDRIEGMDTGSMMYLIVEECCHHCFDVR